jgi:hypothetical protein
MISEATVTDLQQRINDRIAREAPSWHPVERRARADMVAEQMAGPGWQWELIEAIGELPRILLTQYDPRRR